MKTGDIFRISPETIKELDDHSYPGFSYTHIVVVVPPNDSEKRIIGVPIQIVNGATTKCGGTEYWTPEELELN